MVKHVSLLSLPVRPHEPVLDSQRPHGKDHRSRGYAEGKGAPSGAGGPPSGNPRTTNRALQRVKKLTERLDANESEDARCSRHILTRYSHDLYEAGNRELITELGWDTDAFIQGVGYPESRETCPG